MAAAALAIDPLIPASLRVTMRNVLVDATILGTESDGTLDAVIVRGHGFGVRAVRVTISLAGDSREQDVTADAHGHFLARFDRSAGAIPDGCACGTPIGARGADADDPAGCYSSVESTIERARLVR